MGKEKAPQQLEKVGLRKSLQQRSAGVGRAAAKGAAVDGEIVEEAGLSGRTDPADINDGSRDQAFRILFVPRPALEKTKADLP